MVALGALVLLTAVAACGGAAPATNDEDAKASTAAVAPAPKPARPPTLRTSGPCAPAVAVRKTVVKGGLGLFLQKVALDDQPVMVAGRFHGFRIAALRDPRFWSGVDLHPGDVVVHVNGMPIEHPEEALEAFHSLEVASELRVAYDRDGAARELAYTIVDDEAPKRADASAP